MVELKTELRESGVALRAFKKLSGFSNWIVERTIRLFLSLGLGVLAAALRQEPHGLVLSESDH